LGRGFFKVPGNQSTRYQVCREKRYLTAVFGCFPGVLCRFGGRCAGQDSQGRTGNNKVRKDEAPAKPGIVSKQAFILGENDGFIQKNGGK